MSTTGTSSPALARTSSRVPTAVTSAVLDEERLRDGWLAQRHDPTDDDERSRSRRVVVLGAARSRPWSPVR